MSGAEQDQDGGSDRAEPGAVDYLLGALARAVPQARERSDAARSLATALAASPSLDPETTDVAITAATLHELGKLYLPQKLLPLPPLEASPADRATYEQHFEHGRALADAAGMPKRVGAGILHARERWDGEGPQGLSGTEIPIAARVAALCREYVSAPALSSSGDPDPRAAAIAHIQKNAGSLLDPNLCEAAIRAIRPG